MIKRAIGVAIVSLFLIGCDEDYTQKVKADSVLNYSALTYGEVLDKRKLCESVTWHSEKVRNTPTVTYTCILRSDDDTTLSETLVWENSRAMNGFALKDIHLTQVDKDGYETMVMLDATRFMYGAVYDLVDMEKYRKLHLLTK